MEGFNWLNVHQQSGSTSPAPVVSFGSNPQLPLPPPPRAQAQATALADHLPYTSTGASQDSPGDVSIPLSLTAQDLTLQESKTYMRWYSDILARTNTRTITMNDVYTFLANFKLDSELKQCLNRIFNKILYSINIGEFFALLRVIAHTLCGAEPTRRLITIPARVPVPPSILSKKRQNDEDDEPVSEPVSQELEKPLDLDSFTQFMLTGERPDARKVSSKKRKSVKFSDQIVTDVHDAAQAATPGHSPLPQPLDYSLPMNQLLSNMNSRKVDEEEQQVLRDMGPQINHFQNVSSVDTASIDGTPSTIHPHRQTGGLQPNMTGPAQMADMLSPSPSRQTSQLLQPNMTGPAQMARMYSLDTQEQSHPPQITNPEQMAQLFSPDPTTQDIVPKVSLQSFTDQMTAKTVDNTLQNAQLIGERQLPPPPVPARRTRSVSSPIPTWNSNNDLRSPTRGSQNGKQLPPPPPPSRRKASPSVSSPQPPALPPKVALDQPLNQFYGQQSASDSTSDILHDLRALQEEVDKIRDMTGGF